MKELVNSHHKHKVRSEFEYIGCLAVDIAGYLTISVLMGILFVNVFGPLA